MENKDIFPEGVKTLSSAINRHHDSVFKYYALIASLMFAGVVFIGGGSPSRPGLDGAPSDYVLYFSAIGILIFYMGFANAYIRLSDGLIAFKNLLAGINASNTIIFDGEQGDLRTLSHILIGVGPQTVRPLNDVLRGWPGKRETLWWRRVHWCIFISIYLYSPPVLSLVFMVCFARQNPHPHPLLLLLYLPIFLATLVPVAALFRVQREWWPMIRDSDT